MTTASVHLGPPARPPPRVPEAQAPTPGRGHLPLAVLHSLSRLQASEWGRSFSGCLEGLGGTKLLLSPPQHPLTSSKAHLPPRLFQACRTHCLPGQGTHSIPPQRWCVLKGGLYAQGPCTLTTGVWTTGPRVHGGARGHGTLNLLPPCPADITVICPWEAFNHLELHELAQYGII